MGCGRHRKARKGTDWLISTEVQVRAKTGRLGHRKVGKVTKGQVGGIGK